MSQIIEWTSLLVQYILLCFTVYLNNFCLTLHNDFVYWKIVSFFSFYVVQDDWLVDFNGMSTYLGLFYG